MKKLLLAMALVWGLLAQPHAAAAQTGATVFLRHLDTEAFPIIVGYFAARDAAGAPIQSIDSASVQVLEDDVAHDLTQLRQVQPGVRILVVLDPADAFAIRDSQANTRYDYIRDRLLEWASALPQSRATHLTLITPQGTLVQDVSPDQWAAALSAFEPDFTPPVGNAQDLNIALQIAAQTPPVLGEGTAIWWITAAPSLGDLSGAAEWQANLAAQGTPLYVWQVGANSTLQSESAQQLQTLATATGGEWFGFSSDEDFPNPEDYFNPLRTAFFFQYNSTAHTAGTHQAVVQITLDGAVASSQSFGFDLDIQPPNPILVSPPTQIERSPSESDPQQLAPFSQPLEIVVEFPDQFERDLLRTTLYVDGEAVAENSTAPFTRFSWDLSKYVTSQQVSLRVEAEDELGLVGSSIDFPVQLIVNSPPPMLQGLLSRAGPVLAIAGVLLAAGAVLLVLVLSGRLRPPQAPVRRQRRRPRPQLDNDPLMDSPLADETGPLSWDLPLSPADARAPAFLQRLNMQDVTQTAELLPVVGNEIFIGSAPENSIVLAEDSVSPRHTQLSRLDDGAYLAADLGSEAGTWINYAPVSPDGSQLRDGDLLHIGRVAFRFLLNTPPEEVEE